MSEWEVSEYAKPIADPNKRCKWFYEDKHCDECALATKILQDNGFIAMRVVMVSSVNTNCLGNLSACHFKQYRTEFIKGVQ